ncbi:MAG: DUF2189 domain-containing protein [Burkholderiaceae bacterium]|nr:DUF2189 domain-containing protein [Aquabacterium sp.]NUP84893.1 DUF2189 domain-containing protein [Burkholderiaceae bacterium]
MRDSPALIESRRFGVRPIPPLRPLGWLVLGWRDLRRCPLVGLVHGLALAAFGAVLIALAHDRFWLLAGAFSGFLLVAPLSATGLYAVSRALERGEHPGWRTVTSAWRPEPRLVRFGLLLALAGTGWVVTSASFITGFAPMPVERPIDFMRGVVLAEQGHVFETWLLLGGLLAAPVYASSVVALPMLLDRQVGVMVAVLTSWRVVQAHPLPLALWAALLFGLTAMGMATALLGLVVVAPWLAHASWHAYRDLVDTTGLEARP